MGLEIGALSLGLGEPRGPSPEPIGEVGSPSHGSWRAQADQNGGKRRFCLLADAKPRGSRSPAVGESTRLEPVVLLGAGESSGLL